ncbi:MAG: Phosphoenolpyruvate synthase, partial [uncultured Rubrobacteraceae bacterium]
ECSRQRHPLAGRLLSDGARHNSGVSHHDPRVDAAVLPGARIDYRRRRCLGTRLDSCPGVRHPSRSRDRCGDPADPIWPDGPSRRKCGHGHVPGRHGRGRYQAGGSGTSIEDLQYFECPYGCVRCSGRRSNRWYCRRVVQKRERAL